MATELDPNFWAKEGSYSLILFDGSESGPLAVKVFTLPLGPQAYSISRKFRSSTQATMGGLVVEERGYSWWDLNVEVNFGLSPKPGNDQTTSPMGRTVGAFPHAGPMWAVRMLRNVFDRYAELKASPEYAARTRLVWQDTRENEAFLVIPQVVDLDRAVSTRFMYPIRLRFQIVARDHLTLDTGIRTGFVGKLKKALSALKEVQQSVNGAIRRVRDAIRSVSGIIDGISRVVGGFQEWVANVGRVLDEVEAVVNNTSALGQKVSAGTIEELVGVGMSALNLLEASTDLPLEVAHAVLTSVDGLAAIRARGDLWVQTTESRYATLSELDRGPRNQSAQYLEAAQARGDARSVDLFARQGVRPGDREAVRNGDFPEQRSYPAAAGFRPVKVLATDTLESIAARELGDGTRWYELAVYNGLEAPYISETGGHRVATPGATIAVPSASPVADTGPGVVGSDAAGQRTAAALYGTDAALVETPMSAPGRVEVDMLIDVRTGTDVRMIEGIGNLVQALQLRAWTLQGTMPEAPEYGAPFQVGAKLTGPALSRATIALEGVLLQDPRVDSVASVTSEVAGDTIRFEAGIVPIGTRDTRSLALNME